MGSLKYTDTKLKKITELKLQKQITVTYLCKLRISVQMTHQHPKVHYRDMIARQTHAN